MNIKFYMEKYRSNGLFAFVFVVVGIVVLSYVLLHNPYKSLQKDIFLTAQDVHHYYREQPGYWKLSSKSAYEDGLFKHLLKYKEYDIQIGQGVDGEAGFPNDSSFNVVVKHLPRSACINLSELKIPESAKLMLEKVTIINGDENTEFTWGGEHKLPMNKYATRDLCRSQENIIVWTFQ